MSELRPVPPARVELSCAERLAWLLAIHAAGRDIACDCGAQDVHHSYHLARAGVLDVLVVDVEALGVPSGHVPRYGEEPS